MPLISKFYGIMIKMYFNDHLPCHFHAIYNEYNGIFYLNTLEVIGGDLPSKAILLIKEWATQYQQELLNMWNNKEFKRLPEL